MEQKKRSLFLPYILVVIDFDCTITNMMLSDETAGLPLDQKVEVRPFRNFVKYLLSINVKVAIATYGRKADVMSLTNGVFGEENPFNDTNVITPATISDLFGIKWKEGVLPPRGYNKTTMLNLLRGNISPNQILFMDDNEDNVTTAKSFGYQAIQVPSCRGFTSSLRSTLWSLIQINLQLDPATEMNAILRNLTD